MKKILLIINGPAYGADETFRTAANSANRASLLGRSPSMEELAAWAGEADDVLTF
jgi:sulfur relay (sulfurtransferase) complex TusBCD TusD component (DsrE family)